MYLETKIVITSKFKIQVMEDALVDQSDFKMYPMNKQIKDE